MKNLPISPSLYDKVADGRVWFILRPHNNEWYELGTGEEFLLNFGPGYVPLKARGCGFHGLKFFQLDSVHQHELHSYFPELESGSFVYRYAWELV